MLFVHEQSWAIKKKRPGIKSVGGNCKDKMEFMTSR